MGFLGAAWFLILECGWAGYCCGLDVGSAVLAAFGFGVSGCWVLGVSRGFLYSLSFRVGIYGVLAGC